MNQSEYKIYLPDLGAHPKQKEFVTCDAKRVMVRAGRRSGKTFGVSLVAAYGLLAHKRVIYATPTADQLQVIWRLMKRYFREPLESHYLRKNEMTHTIELEGTDIIFQAKTAWNADNMRGLYGDIIILDEYQLMSESVWDEVVAPMMLDTDGQTVFTFTPPSLRTRGNVKAVDKQHAMKMYRKRQADTTGRWKCFHFTSMDNPFLSQEALDEITSDISQTSYRLEILAEDIEEAPGAMFRRETVERNRIHRAPNDLDAVVVGVDPQAVHGGMSMTGIIVAGKKGDKIYVLGDYSINGTPTEWAREVDRAYGIHEALRVVAEANQGGQMVQTTLLTVNKFLVVYLVWAKVSKMARAEPISVLYERGQVCHVGRFDDLEDEMCMWQVGDPSPNRMDALVWAVGDLAGKTTYDRAVESVRY